MDAGGSSARPATPRAGDTYWYGIATGEHFGQPKAAIEALRATGERVCYHCRKPGHAASACRGVATLQPGTVKGNGKGKGRA